MTYKAKHQRLCYLVMLVVCSFCGCQQEPTEALQPTVAVPNQFTDDGIIWKKQSMGPDEEKALTRFFAKHQELMGSPEYEGYPSVFTSSTGVIRFYWPYASAHGQEWRCVEVAGSRFDVLELSDNPFQ